MREATDKVRVYAAILNAGVTISAITRALLVDFDVMLPPTS